MAVLPVGIGPVTGGYQIERSLRFNSADSAYLNRTPASAGNRKTFTWSGWVKRGALAVQQYVFSPRNTATNGIAFLNTDVISIEVQGNAIYTSAVYRDPSAWYHIVLAVDTTQATSSDRVKLYVNGVQVTAFSSAAYPTQNTDTDWNNTVAHNIGRQASLANSYYSGYLTEINFLDGQVPTTTTRTVNGVTENILTQLGEFSSSTGVWTPKAWTGTYGTNGFYLNFSNNTSTQTLGWDQQGNITRYATAGTYSYTVPSYSSSLVVEVWGGGGGGGQALLPGTDATNGGQSSFNGTVIANGGNRGVGASSGVGANGTGGTASGGDTNTTGNTGNSTAGASSSTPSPNSGNSAIAGVIGPGGFNGVTGYPVGSGGGGAYWTGGSVPTGGAGGSGGYSKKTYAPGAISGTITVVVGAGGSAGVGGALNGGAGTAGMVRITVDGATTPSDWYDHNNFSVSAGAGNDSLVDTPTSYGTDTGVGGEVRGNYATWNPLAKGGSTTLSNGNLNVLGSINSSGNNNFSTFIPSSEKWYFEASPANTYGYSYVGVSLDGGLSVSSSFVGGTANSVGVELGNGTIWRNGSNQSTGGTGVSAGEILMVAFEPSSGKVWAGRNGTWYNSGNPAAGTGQVATIPTVGAIGPAVSPYSGSGTISFNFGQRAFAYTAPSGFKALCTQNLNTPTIGATSTTQANDYFNTVIYTGTAPSTQAVTGVGFQPDFVWVKSRSLAVGSLVYDAVRGAGSSKALQTNSTDPEGLGVSVTAASSRGYISSFDSDGFTAADGTTSGQYSKANTSTYVSWNWKANGAGSSNTDGQITSTVSANNDAGFSIVTYTGNGSANQTVGHGCKVGGVATAPVFGILKDLDTNSNNNQWQVFHTAAGDKYAYLSTTAAFAGTAEFYPTSGSSTTVTIARGSPAATTNESGDRYVMYLFAPVAGYSAFGSYTGNGSADGPFVYLGFRPMWLLRKRSDSTSDWQLIDTVREPYNPDDTPLWPNLFNAQSPDPAFYVDMLSNGFKLRGTTASTNLNASGGTYIYAAFAESPFKYSLAR